MEANRSAAPVDLATQLATKLAGILERYEGLRFLGVVDGHGCVEFVFSDDGERGNLLTWWPGRRRVAHGGVANPGRYVAANAVRRAA
jgi:hypothetical protein